MGENKEGRHGEGRKEEMEKKEELRHGNKLMVTEGEREGGWEIWKRLMHTRTYKIEKHQRPTAYYRELYSIFCDNLYGERI